MGYLRIIPVALIVLSVLVSPAPARNPPSVCDQGKFIVFVSWFSGLSRDGQFAQIKFPLKVVVNGSLDCDDEPVWEEEIYEEADIAAWSKIFFDDDELNQKNLIRRIEDISQVKKKVVENLIDTGYVQEFEFIWDGGCWRLTEIRYPSGGC